jgi:uncharacterized membrane protein YeiH
LPTTIASPSRHQRELVAAAQGEREGRQRGDGHLGDVADGGRSQPARRPPGFVRSGAAAAQNARGAHGPTEIGRDASTYELPLAFSFIAHLTFGITGALAGLRRGYDVIGVAFMALVTAIGGGLIRDGILISQGPVGILTNGTLLGVVLVGAVLALVFHRLFDRLGRVIAVIDAIGLGAFAVYGTQKSLEAGLSDPGAVMGGMITCVGGGLLRDVLVREEPLLLKPGQFYALVALLGCVLYMGLPRWGLASPRDAANITIVIVFTTRMLAIRLNWTTHALRREPPTPP